MRKRDLSLLLISLGVALLVVEGLLRVSLEPSSLYGSFRTVPELNGWKNEVRFYERHRDSELVPIHHDPQLGWDMEISGDRIRGTREVAVAREEAVTRIVAIGDSYTFGTDVEADENFAARLDADPAKEVLNMASPGYGIDQAYLKFIYHGLRYQPDVVIFGIYVGDYERTAVSFSAAAKPILVLGPEGLTVQGQPVPDPAAELARIRDALSGRVYVLELLRNAWRRITTLGSAGSYFDATDAIIKALLGDLRQRLSSKQKLLVVHIPRAEAFVESNALRDEMSNRLLNIYAALGIEHINLQAAFVEDKSPQDVFVDYYVQEDSGAAGHLSAAGHARVAELIAANPALRG